MRKLISIITLLLTVLNIQSQSKLEISNRILEERGEICFSFYADINEIKLFSNLLSIDNFDGEIITAYANREEFDRFLTTNKDFEIITENLWSSKALNMAYSIAEMSNWNKYPVYNTYVDMMRKFASDFPEICKLDTIGYSVRNRLLLAVKISDNVNENEAEPEIFYSGQMHGNELVSGMLFLRLIDYLLNEYGTNPQVTELINNTQIYINPLANPDGTYFGGNSNVSFSTRSNSNFVDLNRNFPRPDNGTTNIQPEIQAMINYANSHNFVLSCNSHSGAELLNYPFDIFPEPPADDNWWNFVCREYANNVHNESAFNYNYFTDENNGVTNGYAWYSITGSRQDYMNYFQHCREVTLELSTTKLVDSDSLPYFWESNRKAMLDYLQQATYGLRGIVTDSVTGEPLVAKVFINNHDSRNSHVYSFSLHGDYYRYLYEGTYDVTFSADGYDSKTFQVSIYNNSLNTLNVRLSRSSIYIPEEELHNNIRIFPNPSANFININSDFNIEKIILKDISGKIIKEEYPNSQSYVLNIDNLSRGAYLLNLKIKDKYFNTKIFKE